jgi:hypothetical protein
MVRLAVRMAISVQSGITMKLAVEPSEESPADAQLSFAQSALILQRCLRIGVASYIFRYIS